MMACLRSVAHSRGAHGPRSLGVMASPVAAQFFAFGQNKIQYRKLDWRVHPRRPRRPLLLSRRGRSRPGGAGVRRGELRYAVGAVRARGREPASPSSSTRRTPTSSRPTSFRSHRPRVCSARPISSSAACRFRSAAISPSSAIRIRHEMVHVFQLDLDAESLQPGAPRRAGSTSPSGGRKGSPSSGRPGRTRATRWSCAI